MPKIIASIRKSSQDFNEFDHGGRKRLPLIPCSIFTILLIFFGQAWVDSSSKMSAMDTSIAQQLKLCLVEYTQKNCDALNPVGDCKTLIKCIEERNNWQISKMGKWWKTFSQEILDEFAFPTVVIGLLLLIEVSQGLKKEKVDRHDQ